MQGSVVVKSGTSSYPGNRWGDYFTACRDGKDAGVVWGYGEYADGGGHWGTWAVSLKL